MARSIRNITSEALELPEEERLALASELINSVEGISDPEWEAEWCRDGPGLARAEPRPGVPSGRGFA